MRSVVFAFAGFLLILSGCAALPVMGPGNGNLPVVLAIEEITQPYKKIGRIKVNRTVYIFDYSMPPNLQAWGVQALREEAQKLDADAVIFPEVTSRELNLLIFPAFPATEYTATGVAIKFMR